MKKTCLVFVLALACLTANAQNYVEWLDEIELLGTWNVTGALGNETPGTSWQRLKLHYPGSFVSFQFTDGNYTKIIVRDGIKTTDYTFRGYWVTKSNTNNCLLHLLPGNSESIVNFKVTEFNDNSLTLATYDDSGTITLSKDTSAGVEAARMDAPKGKAHTLNGVELPTPDASKGVIIQEGKKILR